MAVTGPLVWLDQNTTEVKLVGVIEEGINMIGRCGNGSMSVQLTQILDWINDKTGYCNNETCSQGQCTIRDKLKPQALMMLRPDLFPKTTTEATNNASLYHIDMGLWLYIKCQFITCNILIAVIWQAL